MSKIYKISVILLCSALSFSACSDWKLLEEHPKSVATATYLNNEEEVQKLLNSVYYQLRRDPGFSRYLSILPETFADYCWGRGNYATSLETGLTSGAQGFVKDSWAILYRGIRYVNFLLSSLDPNVLTTEQYNRLVGEARFLRAFNYSQLVKYWGGVSLLTEENWEELYQPRSTADEIWKYIITEAKDAADMLPETTANYGRPTKYSAMALLAEAYLYQKDYASAASTLKTIVDSNKYSLVKISKPEDYNNIFSESANGTSEEVFYIKFNRDCYQTAIWMFLASGNTLYPNQGALGIYTDLNSNGVIANWDKNDFRFKWNLQTNNSGTMRALTKNGMICVKFRDNASTTGSRFANDWPVYRYTDILSYYAEAICSRDGKPNELAMEMINKTHRRAYGYDPDTASEIDYKLSDYSTKEKFMELLLQERGYESMFEGKRYADLKRLGLFAEYQVRSGKISSTAAVGDGAYWWPIPTDEFNYNPYWDAETDQNPGY